MNHRLPVTLLLALAPAACTALLGPLSVDDINQLLCDTLRRAPDEMRSFAELVHRRSGGGNPFFAGQFLTSLAEEKLVEFDSRSRSWTISIGSLPVRYGSGRPVLGSIE